MHITFLHPAPLAHRSLSRPRSTARRPKWRNALIAVVGATGGVGSLVIKRLLSSLPTSDESLSDTSPVATKIRAIVRSVPRAEKVLPEANELELFEIPSAFKCDRTVLREALRDVEVLIICTGTTAFPTKAWKGGNTPANVDDAGVRELVEAVDGSMKRVVLLSSVGTGRARQFPFFILNAFGVLDAKRRGEVHVMETAKKKGFSYAIVRAAKLIGAPHTNIGARRIEPNPEKLDVTVASGDTFLGDLTRHAAAEAVFMASRWNTGADLDFSLVNSKGQLPLDGDWTRLLRDVQSIRDYQDIS